MQVVATAIPDVKEIKPVRRFDPRGFFAEIFRESARPEGNGRMPVPACRTVVAQFERLEQFHGQAGLR